MRNRKKEVIQVLCCFCLLVLIGLFPFLVLEKETERLKNQPRLTALISEPSEHATQGESLDAITQLQITQSAMQKGNEVLVEWQTDSDSEKRKAELVAAMEAEVSLLIEQNALPQLTFLKNEDAVYVSKRAYIDMDKSNQIVNIWMIVVDYADFMMSAYMDGDTNALYEIALTSKKDAFVYESQEVLEQGFFNYLQAYSEILKEEKGTFGVQCRTTENVIYYSVVAYNENRDTVASYSFDRYLSMTTAVGVTDMN